MNLPKKTLYISIIISLIIGIYFNTFKNTFQFDDIIHILNNEKIRHLSNLPEMLTGLFSRPLLFASFSINYYISGSSTVSYHAVNILLHIGVSILIYFILLNTVKMYEKFISHHIPFLSALIFALHPVNTESVTYIISRSSILSTFFYLLSLLMFIKANEKRGKGQEVRCKKSGFWLLASGFCFIFALGSKEDAVTLPIMALFYFLFFLSNKNMVLSPIRNHLKIILLFIIIVSIYPLIRYLKLGAIGSEEASGIYTHFTYLLTEFNVIIFYYLKLLFLPINLNVDPDIRPIISIFNLSTLTSLLVISLMLISSFKFFKRDPLISFSILWFFVTLAPTSSIFPLLDPAAEHRAYLSTVGFSILLARLILKIRIKNIYIVPCLLVIILLSFSLCTIKRNFVWKERVSLWEDAVRKSPSKARTHDALGLAYNEERGLIDEAIRQYRIALGIKPLYFDALNNLGIALDMKGDLDGALQKYEFALLMKPNSPELHNNIAIIHAKRGEMDKAVEEFKKAVDLAPSYIKARRNLEMILKGMPNFEGSTSVDSYR
ncbi:MAG: tetratricopeptide repeat protein [Nitrospinae bacterium]|nr:tetratricopeptide repeat protein [Nitrospinota bacterium]